MFCEFIFESPAEVVFPGNKDADSALAVTGKVAMSLFPQHIELFDPAGYNNQCHLYSRFLADYAQRPPNGQTEESRFVVLCFLRSEYFIRRQKLLQKLVKQVVSVEEIPVASHRQLRLFLADAQGYLREAAKKALVDTFGKILVKRLKKHPQDVFMRELLAMAESRHQLQYAVDGGRETVYTYPKFAGVCLLVQELAESKMPFAVKAKVVSREGQGVTTFVYPHPSDKPLITFEGVVPRSGYTMQDYYYDSARCPHSLFQTAKPHPVSAKCSLCGPEINNIEPIREKLAELFCDFPKFLMGAGAAFTEQKQPAFRQLIGQYPILDRLYKEATGGGSTEFQIVHVHPGAVCQIDQNAEEYVTSILGGRS